MMIVNINNCWAEQPDLLYVNCSSYQRVKFHPLHPSAHLCRSAANGLLLPDFYSGATGPSGCFTEGSSLRVLTLLKTWEKQLSEKGNMLE